MYKVSSTYPSSRLRKTTSNEVFADDSSTWKTFKMKTWPGEWVYAKNDYLIRYKWTVKVEWWTRDRKYVDGLFVNPVVLDVHFLSPHHTNSTVRKKIGQCFKWQEKRIRYWISYQSPKSSRGGSNNRLPWLSVIKLLCKKNEWCNIIGDIITILKS